MSYAVAITLTILGLALLMVVHEGGHHLVARAFKLRVVRFSIGFGPALWRYQPRGSETVYQVALIPFLAYVQIAGMNPFEESDPADQGSYANASLTARILTIFAGPMANYAFASVLFLFAFLAIGRPIYSDDTTQVQVISGSRAEAAQMQDGDQIISIGGKPVANFNEMRSLIQEHPEEPLSFVVTRDGQEVQLEVTPEGKKQGGVIGVMPQTSYESVSFQEAVTESVKRPALVVKNLVVGLVELVTRRTEAELAGPVQMVQQGARLAEINTYELINFLGILSAYLGGFNLLPVPALDGGRLMFLGYEAIARRKPNAKIEAQIHAVGLLMFLALIAVVTFNDLQR